MRRFVHRSLGIGLATLVVGATFTGPLLPMAPAHATTGVDHLTWSTSPIAPTGSLAGGSSVEVTVTAYDSAGTPLPHAGLYLSFAAAPLPAYDSFSPKSHAQVSDLGVPPCLAVPLTTTPLFCMANSSGSISVSYTNVTYPGSVPGLTDTLTAALDTSGTEAADTTYTYAAIDHLTWSTSPIAPTGSLAGGTSVEVTVTAYDSAGTPLPHAGLYLSFAPAQGSAAHAQVDDLGVPPCLAVPLTTTPLFCMANSSGSISLSYTDTPFPGTAGGGTDTLTAALDTSGTEAAPDTYTYAPVDTTPPVVTITLSAPNGGIPDGQGGWFVSGPVEGSVVADDTGTGDSVITSLDCGSLGITISGLGTPTASGTFSISAEGITHISCIASDSAGNVSGPVTLDVMLDSHAPEVSLHPASDSCSQPGSNDWCRGTETAGFTASDATSGTVSPCSSPGGGSCDFTAGSSTEGSAVTIASGQVCDVAGNCNPGISAGPFKIDPTAPSVTRRAAADSCSLAGENGWCRGIQTAGFTASDATSGTASPCSSPGGGSCDFTAGSSTEGSAVTIASGQVCDVAGNCNPGISAGPFKIDPTAPTLAPTISPSPVLLHGSATATPNATDATSGVASQSCGAVDASTAGVHTLTCAAKDNAGNTSTASVSYLVGYKIIGFFSPAPNSKWKQGQTVPVKVAIADASGVRISDAEAQGLLSLTCRVMFIATGAQSTSACTKYDTTNHQFIYNWKLGMPTGNVTIGVQISYPGTTSKTTLSETIVVTN
jgi:hypothetical protein